MLKPGTQIAYVPRHIVRDWLEKGVLGTYVDLETGVAKEAVKSVEGVELGFIVKPAHSDNPDGSLDYFCRYWIKGKPGHLRTVANSEKTNEFLFTLIDSVDQEIVDRIIRDLKEAENDKAS